MKKVSIIIPTFKTWRWTAICIHAYKTYGVPIDSEIILVDNAPDSPMIKAITETSLGEGVKIIEGERDFSSHGRGYDLAYEQAEGDWIFCSETDSFPTHHGWFDDYVKASATHDLIGPEVPQSSGTYIHPAGAAYRRTVIESAKEWQAKHKDWVFCPGAAVELGTSSKPYHVIAHAQWLKDKEISSQIKSEVNTWKRAGVFQEMRCFDEDTWTSYPHRIGIHNWEPESGKPAYNKIGFEAGQWLAYYAQSHGFRVLKAPTEIHWMPRHEGGQAAHSTVFGGFTHVWCGTVSNLPNDIANDVRAFKLAKMNQLFSELPELVRAKIEFLEERYTK